MKTITLVTGAMLLMLTTGVVLTIAAQPADKVEKHQNLKKQTTCPIMDGQISTNLFADFDGKRVYFCCGGCPAEFKKEPAKYIAKMEKDGITLDKTPATDTTKNPTTPAAAAPATSATMGCSDKCGK